MWPRVGTGRVLTGDPGPPIRECLARNGAGNCRMPEPDMRDGTVHDAALEDTPPRWWRGASRPRSLALVDEGWELNRGGD